MTVQVTISVDEYNAMRDRIKELEGEREKLIRDAEDARLGPTDDIARKMHQLFGQAFLIVKFAVANLPVLAVRGWPYAALREIAKALPTLPMIDETDREISTDLQLFAREAETWEGHRALGIEKQVLQQENLARQVRIANPGNPGGNFGTTLLDNQANASSLSGAQGFDDMTRPWNKKPRRRVTTKKKRRASRGGK